MKHVTTGVSLLPQDTAAITTIQKHFRGRGTSLGRSQAIRFALAQAAADIRAESALTGRPA